MGASAQLEQHPDVRRRPLGSILARMPRVSTYLLPPPSWKPKGKRYPSAWKLSEEEAAARGLTDADIVPGTTEERQEHRHQSAGLDGVRTPQE
jgi:hypothetical protein